MKSLGEYYRYVKMPRCGYVEHGLEYFSFYVQKQKAHLAACSGTPAGLRRAARGTSISETRLFSYDWTMSSMGVFSWKISDWTCTPKTKKLWMIIIQEKSLSRNLQMQTI